jgi:anti-anti-sigma factor
MADQDGTSGRDPVCRGGGGRPPVVGSPFGVELTIAALRERSGLRLAGEVDLSNRHVWQAVLHAATEQGDDIHMDLSDLDFVDVAAATALVRQATGLGPQRRLVLHDPPPTLRRMIGLLWQGQPVLEMEPA